MEKLQFFAKKIARILPKFGKIFRNFANLLIQTQLFILVDNLFRETAKFFAELELLLFYSKQHNDLRAIHRLEEN